MLKKLCGILLVAVVGVGLLVGCSKDAKNEVKVTYSAKEVAAKVTEGIELPSSMEMDANMFKDTYGIDPAVLDSYIVYMPMMNVKANEVAVFKVKDVKDVEKVKAGIEKRGTALEEQWKTYLPDQYELVKARKVEVKGPYVLLTIGEDAEKIVTNFKTIIQ